MEIIDVVASAHFTDTRIGAVSRKQRIRIARPLAEELARLGLVTFLHPTAATAVPAQSTAPLGDGVGESPASSPADQASPETTATSQESNRGGESSPSTTATDFAQGRTSSTPATDNGGTSTTEPSSRPDSKESCGRKTKARRGATA